MDNIDETMKSQKQVDEAISAVEKYLEPLLALPAGELAEQLGHAENAKLNAGNLILTSFFPLL